MKAVRKDGYIRAISGRYFLNLARKATYLYTVLTQCLYNQGLREHCIKAG